MPKWLLLANGKYRDYYNNLSEENKTLIESQANNRKLDNPESVNKFLASRIFETKETRGFHIPKFNYAAQGSLNSELNEGETKVTSSVAMAMKMLK